MRVMDKRPKVTRRRVLGAGAASLVALTIMPSGMIVGAGNAWAATAKALKPNTFATLLQMARDIYPHDHVADKHYAGVVSSFDDAATKDAAPAPNTRRLVTLGLLSITRIGFPPLLLFHEVLIE